MPAAGAIPATRSKALLATLPAALMLLSVNCGKVSRIATNTTAKPPMIISATLRYVTVVHAMWMPGLRVCEDTLD